mmetsp:Transcript_45397/g.125869  ORF Transcript_45397/g.125869 Transcript_45397/m.125869 type:complete len:181 (+) Transcript_45397:496-1038(+)
MQKARVMQLLMQQDWHEASEVYLALLATCAPVSSMRAPTVPDCRWQPPPWAGELRLYVRDLDLSMVLALFPGVCPYTFAKSTGRYENVNAADFARLAMRPPDDVDRVLGVSHESSRTRTDAEVLQQSAEAALQAAQQAEDKARKAREAKMARRAAAAAARAAARRRPSRRWRRRTRRRAP